MTDTEIEEAVDTPARHPRLLRLLFGVVVAMALAVLLLPRGSKQADPGGFLVGADGRPAPLGQRLAPVTLVHFWATWCPPCIDEIPALHRLADDFAGEPGFRIAFVAVDNDPAQVEGFLGPEKAETVLFDPEWSVAHRFGTRKLPETHLLVDGEVVETFVGATNWDDPKIRTRLKSRLNETTS